MPFNTGIGLNSYPCEVSAKYLDAVERATVKNFIS
jgi:hypothetical protein